MTKGHNLNLAFGIYICAALLVAGCGLTNGLRSECSQWSNKLEDAVSTVKQNCPGVESCVSLQMPGSPAALPEPICKAACDLMSSVLDARDLICQATGKGG